MPSEPERLRDYILSIALKKCTPDRKYNNIGATLADAVLQRNNNYERNVRHRVKRIRTIYADAKTLSDLKRLLLHTTPQEFLDWKGPQRAKTFLELIALLDNEKVDTEEEFRLWLLHDENCEKLRAIRFVGRKTINYLKLLVGLDVAAIDIRLRRFVELAGIGKLSDERCQDVIHRAADLMKWDRADLDHSIWQYMGGIRQQVQPCPE